MTAILNTDLPHGYTISLKFHVMNPGQWTHKKLPYKYTCFLLLQRFTGVYNVPVLSFFASNDWFSSKEDACKDLLKIWSQSTKQSFNINQKFDLTIPAASSVAELCFKLELFVGI